MSEVNYDIMLDFLYQSISDTQGTIRAIDTKLSIIIAILSLPFTTIGKICNRFYRIPELYQQYPQKALAYTMFTVFGLLWLMAFVISFRGLIGIDNPSLHIKKSNNIKGIFFNGDLYRCKFVDAFTNSKKVLSIRTLNQQIGMLPTTKKELVNELAYEQMKLTYIRHMKQLRHNWAYQMTFYWLILGFLIYLTV